jgi:hypothetical protein
MDGDLVEKSVNSADGLGVLFPDGFVKVGLVFS